MGDRATQRRSVLNAFGPTVIGWAVLFIAVFGLLAVGATRDPGPRSAGDRIDDISRRVACPTCDGESVYESRATASENIRAEITAQVSTGERTDDEIIGYIADRFGGQVLLVPRSTGIEALAWAIPVAVLICAIAGLGFAFSRWRRAGAVIAPATEADYAAVAEALAADEHAVPADLDPERREQPDEH